jgi:hypothetical protein
MFQQRFLRSKVVSSSAVSEIKFWMQGNNGVPILRASHAPPQAKTMLARSLY